VAYANLQQDFIQGRVVMMGCPKFDDQALYVQRFTEILGTRPIRSLTVLIMEVPCCSAMIQILKKAIDDSGKQVAVRQVVVSTKGEIIYDKTM